MPVGPQGQKRPADTNACAVMVARIATGEEQDSITPAITRRGVNGAKARATALAPERRSEIAKAASAARWNQGGNEPMASKTERETLSDRFHAMKAEQGLQDMKFHLGRVSEATTEQVCASINGMLDAYGAGQVRWHNGRKPA